MKTLEDLNVIREATFPLVSAGWVSPVHQCLSEERWEVNFLTIL